MTQPPALPPYGQEVRLAVPFDAAVERVTAALSGQGFGILTEIDVRATLKEKLDADFRRYVILGACNPPLAHRALQTEISLGLLLPCNVIVYESDTPGETVIGLLDPLMMAQATGNPAMERIADEARKRIDAVIAALTG